MCWPGTLHSIPDSKRCHRHDGSEHLIDTSSAHIPILSIVYDRVAHADEYLCGSCCMHEEAHVKLQFRCGESDCRAIACILRDPTKVTEMATTTRMTMTVTPRAMKSLYEYQYGHPTMAVNRVYSIRQKTSMNTMSGQRSEWLYGRFRCVPGRRRRRQSPTGGRRVGCRSGCPPGAAPSRRRAPAAAAPRPPPRRPRPSARWRPGCRGRCWLRRCTERHVTSSPASPTTAPDI